MTKKLVLALLATGCTQAPSAPPEVQSNLARDSQPAIADADFQAFIAGNTQFALDLYAQVATTPGNVFMSPLSITEALGMTYAGAANETAQQMAAALHFTLPAATTHAAMDKLALSLATDGNTATSTKRPFQLHDVDALWGQQGLPFQQPFLDTLAVDYGAGVYVQDFASAPNAAEDTINSYISDQTDGTIAKLLPPGFITPATEFVLTNAIYFDAAWAQPFDPNATHDGTFTKDDGSSVAVSMMNADDGVIYGAGTGYQAAELPYDGGTLSMVVIEPTDQTAGALDRLAATLTADRLATVLGSLTDTCAITMPKLKLDAALDLKLTLQALGMIDAFSGAADFSAMTAAATLHIDDVVHQGFLAVDEAGTQAAGATAVSGAGSALPSSNRVVLDHPYLVLIRDQATGAVLFLGRIADPS